MFQLAFHMIQETNASFEVDSRLLLQLGEKLVKGRAVALAELVKNSYDADSTIVKISMHNIKNPGGIIIVEDNGTGMLLPKFLKTWMRIATTDKEKNPITAIFKREKAGEKGIGRFAARSLSQRLTLKSIAINEDGNKEELTAVFNWDSFIGGVDINKIDVKIYTQVVNRDTSTGTTLKMDNTYGIWTGIDIRHLRNELKDLINPSVLWIKEKDLKSDPGFEIEFDIPEFPAHVETLDSTFFKNSWARLVGCVNPEGDTEYWLEQINGEKRQFKRERRFNYIKNIKFEIYIMIYDKIHFAESDWSAKRAAKIGRERGGVRVYADKFRIFGYGSKGDDWLRLEYDRSRSIVKLDDEVERFTLDDDRPGLRIFRNPNLFGYVTFRKEENKLLEITINREHLIENEAFDEMRHFVRLGLDFATVIYSNYLYARQKEEKERLEREREELSRAEGDAIRRANEERIKASEALRQAENRKRKAEEFAKKIETQRRKAEQDRRKAEDERREAERIRSSLETRKGTIDSRKDPGIGKKLLEAKLLEEEKLRKELEAKKIEEILILNENRAKERLDEERNSAEIILRNNEENENYNEKRINQLHEDKKKKSDLLLEMEFSQLRSLASTGTLILIFQHELKTIMTDMGDITRTLLDIIDKPEIIDKDNCIEEIESLKDRIGLIDEFSGLLDLTASNESRFEKRPWVLRPLVEEIIKYFKWYTNEYGITCVYDSIEEDLQLPPMYKSEICSIIHNLLTNAIKAVKEETERKIEIKGFHDNESNSIHIIFMDTGKGLEKDKWEKVFDPFVSYSEPDIKYGSGTGLGLSIVRDFVRTYHGKIRFMEPPANWKTCLQIILPRSIS